MPMRQIQIVRDARRRRTNEDTLGLKEPATLEIKFPDPNPEVN